MTLGVLPSGAASMYQSRIAVPQRPLQHRHCRPRIWGAGTGGGGIADFVYNPFLPPTHIGMSR